MVNSPVVQKGVVERRLTQRVALIRIQAAGAGQCDRSRRHTAAVCGTLGDLVLDARRQLVRGGEPGRGFKSRELGEGCVAKIPGGGVMGRIVLRLSEALYNAAWAHLRPEASTLEEAGFLYGTADHVGEGIEFTGFEWRGIQPHEFATRNEYFIELDDDVRAGVIK